MKQSDKQGQRNKTGAYGEEIAAKYLERRGHAVIQVNYLRKWGEIDLISRVTTNSKSTIHFVEVKTVTHETKALLQAAVSRGTHRPEENVHNQKLQRMYRAIESWLVEREYDGDWQIDVCAVRIVPREKYATIKYLPNIIQ